MSKEYRTMKVCGQSGYKYKSTPTIMLKGQWLKEFGFEENTPITIHCQDGILTITRTDETYYDDVPDSLQMVAEGAVVYGRGEICE